MSRQVGRLQAAGVAMVEFVKGWDPIPRTSPDQWKWPDPSGSYVDGWKITCHEHGGELRYRAPQNYYECVGWDGEGCCYLTAEDIHAIQHNGPLPEYCNAFGVSWYRSLHGIEWVKVKIPAKSEEELSTNFKVVNDEGVIRTWQEKE